MSEAIVVIRYRARPDQVMLLERWVSREAFVGPHMQQPHIRSFIATAGVLFAGPPDVSFWQPLPEDGRP